MQKLLIAIFLFSFTLTANAQLSKILKSDQGYAAVAGFMLTDFKNDALSDVDYAYRLGIGYADLIGANGNYDITVEYNFYQNNTDGINDLTNQSAEVYENFDGFTFAATGRWGFSPSMLKPHAAFTGGINMLSSETGRKTDVSSFTIDWFLGVGGGVIVELGPIFLIAEAKYVRAFKFGDNFWPISLTIQFHPKELTCCM